MYLFWFAYVFVSDFLFIDLFLFLSIPKQLVLWNHRNFGIRWFHQDLKCVFNHHFLQIIIITSIATSFYLFVDIYSSTGFPKVPISPMRTHLLTWDACPMESQNCVVDTYWFVFGEYAIDFNLSGIFDFFPQIRLSLTR